MLCGQRGTEWHRLHEGDGWHHSTWTSPIKFRLGRMPHSRKETAGCGREDSCLVSFLFSLFSFVLRFSCFACSLLFVFVSLFSFLFSLFSFLFSLLSFLFPLFLFLFSLLSLLVSPAPFLFYLCSSLFFSFIFTLLAFRVYLFFFIIPRCPVFFFFLCPLVPLLLCSLGPFSCSRSAPVHAESSTAWQLHVGPQFLLSRPNLTSN